MRTQIVQICAGLVVAGLTLFDSPASAAPGYAVAKVAVSGDPTPMGGTFGGFFGNSLNNLGHVVFIGFIAGSNNHALFVYQDGSLSTLLSRGEVLPGGGSISGFGGLPSLNDAGHVAFSAGIRRPNGSLEDGILLWKAASITTVARVGAPTPLGGTFRIVELLSGQGSINASGHVVFRTSIAGGAAPEAIFVWDGSGHRTIAAAGDATPIGGTFTGFRNLNNNLNPAINDNGDVVFFATVTGGSADKGIFLRRKETGSVTAVVTGGQPSPLGGVFGAFDLSFTGPSLNNDREVAFGATIVGGPAAFGVFRWKEGTVTKVIAGGDVSPEPERGCPFMSHAGSPTLNDEGELAFAAAVCTGRNVGVFVQRAGIIETVVSPFEPTPVGGTWGSVEPGFGFNMHGQIAFRTSAAFLGEIKGIFVATPGSRPPTADAGSDVIASAGAGCQANVPLDGSASSDPDGDALTYAWAGSFGSATGASPTVTLALGIHTITLTVNDGRADSPADTLVVTVIDDTAPVLADVLATVTAEQTGPEGAIVRIPFPTATDNCGSVIVTGDVPAIFPPGTTVVTFTARDAAGNTASATTTVTVRDTTPPVIAQVSNLTLDSTSPQGATVHFVLPTVADAVDPSPTVFAIPPSGSVLPVGSTTVVVSALDSSGNASHADFTVTVLSASQMISNLIDAVSSLSQADNLLRNALRQLAAGKSPPACNQVAAFINHVRAQSGKHVPVSHAAQWTAAANRVRAAVGCR